MSRVLNIERYEFNGGIIVSELVSINKKDSTLNQSSRYAANFVILGKVELVDN